MNVWSFCIVNNLLSWKLLDLSNDNPGSLGDPFLSGTDSLKQKRNEVTHQQQKSILKGIDQSIEKLEDKSVKFEVFLFQEDKNLEVNGLHLVIITNRSVEGNEARSEMLLDQRTETIDLSKQKNVY